MEVDFSVKDRRGTDARRARRAEPAAAGAGALTAAEKRLLKREYKKAHALLGGVGPAWRKRAIRALRHQPAELPLSKRLDGASSARARTLMGRAGLALAGRRALRIGGSQPRAIAAAGAFVACFAIVLGAGPRDHSSVGSAPEQVLTQASLGRPAEPDRTRPLLKSALLSSETAKMLQDSPSVRPHSDPAPEAAPSVTPPLAPAPEPMAPAAAIAKPLDIRPTVQLAAMGSSAGPLVAVAPPPAIQATYVGVWGADQSACSARNKKGLLPTVIDTEGARAGDTFCRFTKKKHGSSEWTIAAACLNGRERWTSKVRLKVQGTKLTWSSERGTQTYVRCEPGVMMAQVD